MPTADPFQPWCPTCRKPRQVTAILGPPAVTDTAGAGAAVVTARLACLHETSFVTTLTRLALYLITRLPTAAA